MSDARTGRGGGHAEPSAVAAAMAEAMAASVEHPHRFEAVFDRYHPVIYAYVAHLSGVHRADELAGDVFVTAFTVRTRFDPAFGSVRAWLFGIAANLVRTSHRSEHRGIRAQERIMGRRADEDTSIDDVTDRIAYTQELVTVTEALDRLAFADRQVIVLYAFADLSYPEIATALGVEVGTVRSRMNRARRRLRELVGFSGEVPSRGGEQTEDEPWTSSSG
jgi:RNA polymerase sigma-70 factor, ECF subfamily